MIASLSVTKVQAKKSILRTHASAGTKRCHKKKNYLPLKPPLQMVTYRYSKEAIWENKVHLSERDYLIRPSCS